MSDPTNSDALLDFKDYHKHFDTDAYLDFFYGPAATQDGLKILLFALPNIVRRLPQQLDSLLNVGSGPTIYVALCFRHSAKTVTLTDFAEQSCEALKKWKNKEDDAFNWRPVARCIAEMEGTPCKLSQMEEEAREVVTDITRCDVHASNLFLNPNYDENVVFHCVTTIFCLESACANLEEYRKAMKNVVKKVRPGGYFIIGSVLEDDTYEFGTTHKFKLLYLTEEDIVGAMREAGLEVDETCCLIHAGVFVSMAKKPML